MSGQQRRVFGLVALFGGSGMLHFLAPRPYRKIVPPGLGDPATLVAVSGVAELACAALVAAPATRRVGGLFGAGLLVGVFPANVYAVKVAGVHRLARLGAIARLPLQVPMITAALRVAREA